MSYLDDLNPEQRAAAAHGEGPLLIVAGAGTGKTKTLACRVAHLIETGVAPERILLLTFTRRAAGEMLRRAGRFSDGAAAGRVWGGTFHAVANRLLRSHAPALGLPPSFTVVDQTDAADLMGLVRNDLDLAGTGRRFPKKETLTAIYSRSVNEARPLDEVLERYFPWCSDDLEAMRTMFRAFTERKRAQYLLDYDDLLLYWRALVGAPGLGESIGDAFDQVLVDEYQDTNALQAEILRGMRRNNDNVTVVGDDAQAIYSFRSATARNILDFPDQFPGTTTVMLEQNYRSTQPILEVSNAVMAQARERFTKILWSGREDPLRPVLLTCLDESRQAELVCRAVLENRELGMRLMDQAVLFRAAWHSDLLELELARRNIPFVKYGGIKFLEAAHVKDVMSYLRVLENPADELAWFRMLQTIEGIGPARARQLMSSVGVGEGADRSPLDRLIEEPPALKGSGAEAIVELAVTLGECRDEGIGPGAEIDRVRAFYDPLLSARYDSAPARLRDLDQLAQIAATFKTRAQFITDLTLDPPASTEDLAGRPGLDEDYLILSTIHSAKGCEWASVHVIQAADGMIPSDMALSDDDGLEEERRLFYVALTRAKRDLRVYFPLRLYYRRNGFGDGHAYAQLTRFVSGPAYE
ncbi:MAG TPA: ATP-dependent helicase, partial [Actinomycetota bacterium]|nr:ATP-dependent helicase [Actinomycetota bacterium]